MNRAPLRFAFVFVGLVLQPLLCTASTALAPGVLAENLPGGLRINGVAVQVTRLTGQGVPAFIHELQSRWQVLDGIRREGPWQVVSRQGGSTSEVLQWRSTVMGHEALWSRLDLRQSPRSATALSFPLPVGCRIANQLELGEAQSPVRHLTARCGVRADTLSGRLHQAAVTSGWQVQHTAATRTLLLQRGQTRVQLSVVDEAEPGALPASVLVAIEDRNGAPR